MQEQKLCKKKTQVRFACMAKYSNQTAVPCSYQNADYLQSCIQSYEVWMIPGINQYKELLQKYNTPFNTVTQTVQST